MITYLREAEYALLLLFQLHSQSELTIGITSRWLAPLKLPRALEVTQIGKNITIWEKQVQ